MVKQGPRGTRTKEKGPQLTVVGSVGDARSWPREETSLAEAGEVGWGFKIPLGGSKQVLVKRGKREKSRAFQALSFRFLGGCVGERSGGGGVQPDTRGAPPPST